MGHDQAGRVGEHAAQRLLDELLGVHVERRERVVEDEDARLGEHGPRQGEPLPLAAGQRHALLADAGVEAPRQVEGEVGLRDREGLADLGLGGLGAAEGEVLAGAHREQRRLLERRGDERAEPLEREVADVDAVEGDPAAGDVVEARHQRGEARLAAAGGPDQRDRLARQDLEVDVAQHELVGLVGEGEVDVLEAQVAALGGHRLARAVDDVGIGVEDLEDACGGGHRLLGHREDHAQGRHRPHQRQHQGDEGDQLAGCQDAPAHADRAEQQHDRDGDVGDHLEERPEAGGEPDLLEAGAAQLLRRDVVLLGDVLAPAEGLDHPDADGALLGAGGQVALLVLDPPRQDDVPLLEAHREPHDRTGGEGDDQAERPVHVEQHGGHRGDLQDVDDQEEQPEPGEPADGGQVRGDAREQLAGLPLAVEAHRELLQPLVEVVAHRGLHREHRVGLHPAAPEDQHRLEDAEGQREQAQRQHAVDLAVGDRAVDQRLGDQRDGDRERDAAERGAEHDRQGEQVGPKVAAQPPQRLDAGGRVVCRGGDRGRGRGWWHRLVDDTTHHRRGGNPLARVTVAVLVSRR